MTTDFIERYERVYSKDECKDIIGHIEYLENHSLMFHDDSNLHAEDHRSFNLGVDYELDLPATNQIFKKIVPKFQDCVNNYIKKYSLLQHRKWLVYDCKLKKIPAGAGFHTWHFENGSLMSSQRHFVIQIYLNDEFEGGETEFLYQNKREKAVAGDVIIFPCGYTHTHRGNAPIGGTKYLATSWGWIQGSEEDEY
tara:strand:- start:92 stop:676 length:585 start_codon:yes stop_codon:yes gene_type:complete